MRLNVVVFRGRETGKWLAMGLERCVHGTGETPEAALASLRRVIQIRYEIAAEIGSGPWNNLPPAPPEYWDLFQKADPVAIEPHAEIEAARVVSAA